MKRMLAFLVVGFSSQLAFSALLETTSEAERIIDSRYATERSHRMALKRLDAILNDENLSDAEKERRIRTAFLALCELTSENAGDLLLYTPILSWRIHSLAVAYDLDGRYESIVSRDRLAESKASQTVGSNTEKTQSDNKTVTGETSGNLHAEAGLMFGIIPKLAANADAKAMKTSSNTSSTGNMSAWTRQDQASLNARYESVMKELSETKLSGLHIRFVIEFSNNTGKDMIVPTESIVPVYAGSAFSIMAKMESSVPLNIPAFSTVDIAFRGDLATTAARELIDFMRTNSPVIAPERSPLLIIRSADGTVANAVIESRKVACARVVCGAYTWCVRKMWNGKNVTIRQAMEAVNSRYDIPPFAWDGKVLKSICGAAVDPLDVEKIPCVETDEGIAIDFNDISKPLVRDEIRFGVMNAEAFIVGKGRRWNDLTRESQGRLIARLRNLKNDAAARYLLGVCYEYGLGVGQSAEKAAECYHESAKGGDPHGQYEYGQCFYYGWGGVDQSYDEAAKWCRASAEQGNAAAQSDLGFFYEKGQGVEQSYDKAVKWYRAASEQGNAAAQNSLGDCYYYGRGIDQSHVEAVKWLRKAAEQGHVVAQSSLADCYLGGVGVEQSSAAAMKWLRKAAEQGYAAAQYYLGYCYANGLGLDQSYEETVKWYRKAAEQGYAVAQLSLGHCYDNGQSVEQSSTEAVKWYRKLAEQGNAVGQKVLGVRYAKGKGVEKSVKMAMYWFRKAQANGANLDDEELRYMEQHKDE